MSRGFVDQPIFGSRSSLNDKNRHFSCKNDVRLLSDGRVKLLQLSTSDRKNRNGGFHLVFVSIAV